MEIAVIGTGVRNTARNLGPVMGTAAELTTTEAEELVERGQLDPVEIVSPRHLRRLGCCGD
jgi:acyl CoA:acetate/3-ketoacid CoA transferase alpha subunit